MDLIIVESPTKAKTLSKFLKGDYEVEATVGHLKDLPKSKLSVDVDHDFAPLYEVVPKKEKNIKVLLSAAKRAKNIYIASDPDREGEAIAAHAKEIIEEKLKDKKTPIKRISFHEITQSAVEEAIADPHEIDVNLVDAQTARRVLDRLVGYSLSPLLWRKVRRGLSAGRVQSVAVRLIAEREKQIEDFKPVEYWEIYVDLQNGEKFAVVLSKINGKKAELGNGVDSEKIVKDLEISKYKVLGIKRREVKNHAYPPFITSTMTQSGSRILGWSSKRTMQMAQSLYEQGLITYHRTDSTNIAKVAVDSARNYIKKQFGENYIPQVPNSYKIKSKNAQEAHEAIRPTNIDTNEIDDPAAQKLYNLIWRRFLASQMSPSVYDETSIEVEANPGNSNLYSLRTGGRIIKFDGFRRVYGGVSDDEQKLPVLEINQELKFLSVDPQQKFTEPPPRYNEASLVKTLEKLGIGRPSTYASIISTIQARSYVEKTDGKFFATTVGIAVNEFLTKNFDNIVDYQFTAGMEDNLDKIAKGETKWVPVIRDFWDPFTIKVKDVGDNAERVKISVEKIGEKCPDCKEGDLVIRVGRFGKFISCSRFPDCKHTAKFQDKVGMKCPTCEVGDVILKRTKKGRKFFGCSRYPDCDFVSWKKPGTESPEENE